MKKKYDGSQWGPETG